MAGMEPQFNSNRHERSGQLFCDGKWCSNGYQHWCLKRKGHDGPCWCCDEADGGYPGGDLSSLERTEADQ